MSNPPIYDAVLVGAGIMSATLGTLLRKLEPDMKLLVFERQDRAASESSDAWNNAGTGHAAYCELNYTPEFPDGTLPIAKALKISEQFELSRQFWASLVDCGDLPDPTRFIRQVPHMSFVWGEDNVSFLRRRFELLQRSPLFEGMELTTDPSVIARWIPLIMSGRDPSEPVAATRMPIGNDVNYGALTRAMLTRLDRSDGAEVRLAHEVVDFRHKSDGIWRVKVRDIANDTFQIVRTRFLFLGAGGGTLRLLEATGIPEAEGYGGFPVSGQWLRCTNRSVIERHHAKVYGKAALGAPPMSVPHLDSRWIDGEKQLLFGPYAGFTTKFLKEGSFWDLFGSLGFDNIVPMLEAGVDNIDLTRYLIGQALKTPEERVSMLRQYYPDARDEDWELEIAGLRVQIIKNDGSRGGVLQFGTEVVTSEDGSVAALLGASPGASTAVAIMLDLVQRCFPQQSQSEPWQTRLRELVPSFGRDLHVHAELCRNTRERNARLLRLA